MGLHLQQRGNKESTKPSLRSASGFRYRALLTPFALCVFLAVGMMLPVVASAENRSYFSGMACCSHRHYDGINSATTANDASATAAQIACVQEIVNPNTQQSFYDSPACGSGTAYHSLNGQSVDKPLCWLQGSTREFSCAESDNDVHY